MPQSIKVKKYKIRVAGCSSHFYLNKYNACTSFQACVLEFLGMQRYGPQYDISLNLKLFQMQRKIAGFLVNKTKAGRRAVVVWCVLRLMDIHKNPTFVMYL